MPCLIVIVALAFPRVFLFLVWLFSSYLERAYHGILLPLLGFLFLPLTTLVYAWIVNTRQPVAGIYLVVLVIAVIIDVGSWGGARRRGAG